MAKIRFLAVAVLALVGMVAFGGTAQAQPDQPVPGLQGNAPRNSALAIGNLISALIAVQDVDVELTNVLNRNLNRNRIEIVKLEDVLNDSEINVVRDILNNSPILSNNVITLRNVLNNNELFKNFLNNNDIDVDIDDVVAVDVLRNGRVIVYVLSEVLG